jgi:hypothetical protein
MGDGHATPETSRVGVLRGKPDRVGTQTQIAYIAGERFDDRANGGPILVAARDQRPRPIRPGLYDLPSREIIWY